MISRRRTFRVTAKKMPPLLWHVFELSLSLSLCFRDAIVVVFVVFVVRKVAFKVRFCVLLLPHTPHREREREREQNTKVDKTHPKP